MPIFCPGLFNRPVGQLPWLLKRPLIHHFLPCRGLLDQRSLPLVCHLRLGLFTRLFCPLSPELRRPVRRYIEHPRASQSRIAHGSRIRLPDRGQMKSVGGSRVRFLAPWGRPLRIVSSAVCSLKCTNNYSIPPLHNHRISGQSKAHL
jgi:hypothetical protein